MKRFLKFSILFMGLFSICNADQSGYHHQENYILPQGTHLLAAKAIDGSIIELEDGSQFTISSSDRDEVREWRTQSPITISANSYWQSNNQFYITNRLTGVYVSATYSSPPTNDHPFATEIYHIDPFEGEIILVDGRGNKTAWEIDPQDLDNAREWQINESVVIGAYNNWYSKLVSRSRFILISYENLPATAFIRVNARPL